MKKTQKQLAATFVVLALGAAVAWWVDWKKDSEVEKESPKISILFKGTLRETKALERILSSYAEKNQPLAFEIFQQASEAQEMPAVPFSLVMADLETLQHMAPQLDAFDRTEVPETLKLEPSLLKDGKAISAPLYEHQFMALYYDKRKVIAKAENWVDLALALTPLTNRMQHIYGLAMAEDAAHSLPFFASTWDPSLSAAADQGASGYKNLSLLRHAIPVVPLDCAAPCADAIFAQGKAAMALSDDGQMDTFAKALGSDNLGVMPLPSGKSPRLTQFLGFAHGMPASEHRASTHFVRYLYSPEGQKEIFREFRSIPSFALQDKNTLDDPLAVAVIEYLRQSTVPLVVSARAAALGRLEPSLKSYLSGRIGETEATLALSNPKELKTKNE